jgi:glycosyltransferase involved in cell wall biosynthesis
MLPFARNDATRFISPTKTPEYLAAGCPVVSTSIRDVVRPYADLGLVHIADDADGFVAAIEKAMHEDAFTRQAKVEACLAGNSWEATWARMNDLIAAACRPAATIPATSASVAHV